MSDESASEKRGRWLRVKATGGRLLAVLLVGGIALVACRGSDTPGSGTAGAAVAQTAPTAQAGIVAPSFLGVNVASHSYYSGQQVYQNLLIGTSWVTPAPNWPAIEPSFFDRSGNLVSLPPFGAIKILTPPESVLTGAGATIRCTWTGTGSLSIKISGGTSPGAASGDHSWEFRWTEQKPNVITYLELTSMAAGDPVRNLDCREKAASADLFSPELIASLKPFGVLRFMDWSSVNANSPSITWSSRTLPENLTQTRNEGVALEHMVALTNAVGSDAWFNVPWNADADYVQRMAQLVHDGVPATHHVYVEVANEVWNGAFAVQHQAEAEGLAKGLSTNAFEASQRRYAERTIEVMKVWTRVFADRPGQLVRVAASQDVNSADARTILSYADTANWVDALATAPYFGLDLFSGTLADSSDLDALMPALSAMADAELRGPVVANQAVAREYGKRLITYEAGQHVLNFRNVDVLGRINRDDRMYGIYQRYLAAWKSQVNDTMVLYIDTSPISQYGAFGLREYGGQPLSQTPKRRAALDAIGR